MSPDYSRIAPYYHHYVQLVDQKPLLDAFKDETEALLQLLNSIPADKQTYQYAPGKWSIKDVLQHIIDAERIFAYRALRVARNDKTALPSFDENNYAGEAKADRRDWNKLMKEFIYVRECSQLLFESFSEEELNREGIASGAKCYVAGIGFIILGHGKHHAQILESRYLS